jgi:uncharacterized protein (TIGR03435 family)
MKLNAAVCLLALLSVGFPDVCRGQSAGFEVATVKVNHSGSGGSSFPQLRNGVLRAENVSMRSLLQAAYGLSGSRVVGPAWLDSDRFDLAGKAPEGKADGELMPMLQALLKERFHLAVHREMKEMPVYHLIVAAGGVKMARFDPAHPPATPRNRSGAGIVGTGTMGQLANMLANAAGHPVVDDTGLEGRFSYSLFFAPLTARPGDTDGDVADLFTAIQAQLGLRLEGKRESLEVLVVDQAERVPPEN